MIEKGELRGKKRKRCKGGEGKGERGTEKEDKGKESKKRDQGKRRF